MISTFRFHDAAGLRAGGALFGATIELAGAGKELDTANVAAQGNQDARTARAPRILIVEDNLMVAWHLEGLVNELNFEVLGLAADANEAIRCASDLQPNCLLMDINLGKGLDGVEAARRICKTVDTAVLFITAYNDANTLARVRETFPHSAVLAKPVTLEALSAAIARTWKQKYN